MEKSKEGKGGKMSKEEKSNEEKSNKKVDKAEKGGKKASPATANKTSGNKNVPVDQSVAYGERCQLNKMDTPMTTNCCDKTLSCEGTSVWYCGGDCSVFPSQC